MPWMPEFFTAPIAEARRHGEAALANDAVPYYEGIMADEPEALLRSFAAQHPVLDDPRVGYVEGERGLRAFVTGTAQWLRERDAVVENAALTHTPTRTVEEVVLHLLADDGGRVELPVAIVSDRNPNRTLKVIRVYHSMWPLTGEHGVRSSLLPADPALQLPGGVVSDYQKALAKGDVEGIVRTFEADGYVREPSGNQYLHRGTDELRAFYAALFGRGSGILQRGPEPIRSLYETLSATAVGFRWSTAPSPTTACGALSSTMSCIGGRMRCRRKLGLRYTSAGTVGSSQRRASTRIWSRQPPPIRPPASRTF